MSSPAATRQSSNEANPSIGFLLDANLGLYADQKPWSDFFPSLGIVPEPTTDLAYLDRKMAAHEPDMAYVPAADYHRLFGKGDRTYRGLAIATSKFTGQPRLKSLLIVRTDDPATGMDDLKGSKYAYINRSCSSSYFPPALILNKKGIKLEEFLEIVPTKVGPTWQELVDAVIQNKVRATMILEDSWKLNPKNAEQTKVIGEYSGGVPAVFVVREHMEPTLSSKVLDALVAWTPRWDGGVYGPFRPYSNSDVYFFFHELDALPPGM